MKSVLKLILLAILVSCSIIVEPDEYETIEGDSCIVICDGSFSREEYESIQVMADLAIADIREFTGIDLTFLIPFYFEDRTVQNADGFALGNGIYLRSSFLSYDTEYQRYLLRHEITHLFFSLNFGYTTSFLFSEGTAEYFSHNMVYDKGSTSFKDELEDWIELSYIQYFLNEEEYTEINEDLYLLSYQFIYFWSKTYGENSLFELYPEITAENIVEKLEDYSRIDFDELAYNFRCFIGNDT